MSTADDDMFDKMLGSSVQLKKRKPVENHRDYFQGFEDGFDAGQQDILNKISDDWK